MFWFRFCLLPLLSFCSSSLLRCLRSFAGFRVLQSAESLIRIGTVKVLSQAYGLGLALWRTLQGILLNVLRPLATPASCCLPSCVLASFFLAVLAGSASLPVFLNAFRFRVLGFGCLCFSFLCFPVLFFVFNLFGLPLYPIEPTTTP